MKVMIAYDGSPYADAALDDLRRAGLPREAIEMGRRLNDLKVEREESARGGF